jgi:chromate transporter
VKDNRTKSQSNILVPFSAALRTWLKIGLLSFGGPAGQIATMHRILVEEKRWISESRFLHALNYCMLLPGPEAQQLAIYIGWLMHRTLGGIAAGVLFVLPGFFVMMGLSALYAGYHDVSWVAALFFGLKAAVLAVVVEALLRIGKKALKNNTMIAIAAASFVAIFFLNVPFPFIILIGALIGITGSHFAKSTFQVVKGHAAKDDSPDSMLDKALDAGLLDHIKPSAARAAKILALWLTLWITPVAVCAYAYGFDDLYTHIGLFFSKMAVVTFGGAYAVLAYVAQEAVQTYHWLIPGEMLDGLGLAETTPGPLILVLQYVGFMAAYRHAGAIDPMLAGVLGATLTVWVTFIPCFLWIFLGAPYVEHLRNNCTLTAGLSAITAAVVGVVLNLAVWFGLHTLFSHVRISTYRGITLNIPDLHTLDIATLVLAIAAMVMMFRFKLGMIPTLAICSMAGIAYKFL